MKFKSAATLMELGFKIRRNSWEPGAWIGIMGFNMHPYISYDDIIENDWDILDESNVLSSLVEIYEECMGRSDFDRKIANFLENQSRGH